MVTEYDLKSIDQWENRPAQIEEINQTIYNHRGHDSWYCFDTAYLLQQQEDLGFIWGKYNDTDMGKSKCYVKLKDIRYDFLIINTELIRVYKKDKDGNILVSDSGQKVIDWSQSGTVYTFTVRNTLWDGTIKVSKSMSSSPITPTPDIFFDAPNNISVTVMGEQSMSVRVCFHMTQRGYGREGNHYQIINTKVYEDQYDEIYVHQGMVIDTLTMKGVNNVKVTLTPCDSAGNKLTEGIGSATATTKNDVYIGKALTMGSSEGKSTTVAVDGESNRKNAKRYDGVFNMKYGKVARPAVYYVLLTATYKTGLGYVYTSSQVVQVNKVQKNSRSIKLPADLTSYKGEIKTFTAQLQGHNKYGNIDSNITKKFKGQVATITWYQEDGTYQNSSCIVQESGEMKFDISFRKYYANTSKLRILVHGTGDFPAVSKTVTLQHKFFRANSFREVRDECYRTKGADYILVEPKEMINSGNPIVIKRDQTITGIKNNTWATFKNSQNRAIVVEQGSPDCFIDVHINGIKFEGARDGNIFTKPYTRITLRNCFFTHNAYKQRNMPDNPLKIYSDGSWWECIDADSAHGTCLFNLSNSTSRANRKMFVNNVIDCYFFNNKGNCLKVGGTTNVEGCKFILNERAAFQQPDPYGLIIDAGDAIYKNNFSYINAGTQPFKLSRTWAKAMFFIDKQGTLNHKAPTTLDAWDSLPLYSAPWNNRAYTYAIYWYYFSQNTIVCSPKPGHESRATAHVTSGEKYAFGDGYYLGSYNRGRNLGNRKDPFKGTSYLNIPTGKGVYDTKTQTFTEGFAPDSRLMTTPNGRKSAYIYT